MIRRKKIVKAAVVADYVGTGLIAVGGVNHVCGSAHSAVGAAIEAAPIDGRVKAAAKIGATIARVAIEVDCDRMVLKGLGDRCRRDLQKVDQQ